MAILDVSGEKKFYVSSEESSAWGTTLPEGKDYAVASLSVKTSTLDEFVSERGIKQIDFMKVDVEGGEFELMEGAQDTFKRKVIRKLYIECSEPSLNNRNKTLKEYLDMFARVNYKPVGEYEDIIEKMKRKDVYKQMNISLLFEPK